MSINFRNSLIFLIERFRIFYHFLKSSVIREFQTTNLEVSKLQIFEFFQIRK